MRHIARTCLWRKAWTVCKLLRSSECYQRQMTWCWWSDNEKSNFAVEKAFGGSGKAEWRTYSLHFLLISWLMITVTIWRSLRTTSDDMNDEPLANIVLWHSFVSRLIQKCGKQQFLDLIGDVCSLNMSFSLHFFRLLYCIMPCESSGPPGMYGVFTSTLFGFLFIYALCVCVLLLRTFVWNKPTSWW